MNRQRMKTTLIAVVLVIVASGGPGGSPSAAMARQFIAVATSGDPGDGFGAEPSGGGFGDPTDGLDGDPTDGNGRTLLVGDQAAREEGPMVQGVPGDGAEVQSTHVSGSQWWRKWLDLVSTVVNLGSGLH